MASTLALTIADLEAMPDDGRRYELIGGAIVMTPAPSTLHQRALRRLSRTVEDACPPGHEVFFAPTDLDLPGEQRVEPDLILAPAGSITHSRLITPVLLVVEIVSPGSRTNDRVTKRVTYAEAGIPHYWVVDIEAGSIALLRLLDGRYETVAEGADITTTEPVAVELSISGLIDP
ncbi:MAG: Uma2 family endonuclease [Acidimicrobiales bacterium]